MLFGIYTETHTVLQYIFTLGDIIYCLPLKTEWGLQIGLSSKCFPTCCSSYCALGMCFRYTWTFYFSDRFCERATRTTVWSTHTHTLQQYIRVEHIIFVRIWLMLCCRFTHRATENLQDYHKLSSITTWGWKCIFCWRGCAMARNVVFLIIIFSFFSCLFFRSFCMFVGNFWKYL